MRKIISAAITEIGEQIGLDTANISSEKERVRRWINDTREYIYDLPYNFNAAKFVSQLRIYGTVTAGTLTPSANGKELTGSSTTWATDLVAPYNQWFLTLGGRTYQVEDVSSNTILRLSVPYAGTATASGASYTAFRKFYPLDYETDKIWLMKEHSQPIELNYMSIQEKEYYYNDDNVNKPQDWPVGYTLWGSDEIGVETIYTGITATANGFLVNGTGSSFLDDDLHPGATITIGDSTTSTAFTLERIVSPTQLRMQQRINQTVNAVTATARDENISYLEFIPNIAKSDIYTIYGYRKYFQLHGDKDTIEDGWWHAVRAGSIMRGYEYLHRPVNEKSVLFQESLRQLIREQTIKNHKYSRLRLKLFDRRRI